MHNPDSGKGEYRYLTCGFSNNGLLHLGILANNVDPALTVPSGAV